MDKRCAIQTMIKAAQNYKNNLDYASALEWSMIMGAIRVFVL